MANDLFNLFRDTLKSESDNVATGPLTLENISEFEEEQDLVLEKIAAIEEVDLKVDYSEYSNFVFFNSALDYFNITGEKILNEYPFAGTQVEIERFKRSLDGYQRYALAVWPKSVGYLRFDTSISSSYIKVDDIGSENGVARGGLLSPGTGSLTIEAWFQASGSLTGTEEVQILAQKLSGSAATGGHYSLYLTGSDVAFTVKSGSQVVTVKAPFVADQITYVAGVMDRSSYTGSLFIMTGSQAEFPVIVNSSSLNFHSAINLATVPLTIASGSGLIESSGTKDVLYYSGSLDDVRIWKKARSLTEISGAFNVKHYAQKNLVALYRFNESGSAFDDENNKIVLDYSGHNLTGRIADYYSDLRVSGTFLIKEFPDPILNVNTSNVLNHITEQQASGTLFDRENSNKITDLLPENYFTLEEINNTEVLKNFAYILARHYDQIKLHVDQFVHILHVNYGEFNQTPDALLDDVAQFFGWEFTGNFLNTEAFQYLIGRNILHNVRSNEDLDTRLFEIKNKFWKRVLLNLMYFYKTKGTKESIKAFLRTYGLSDNFVRIKEYGHSPDVGVTTQRIHADKSVSALGFASGTLTGSIIGSFATALTQSWTIEGTFRFPLTSSDDVTVTSLSGTMMSVSTNPAASGAIFLMYQKDTLGSHTGTLILSSSDGSNYLTLSGAGIFNNQLQHIAVVNDHPSGTLSIRVKHLDEDSIDSRLSSSLTNVTGGLARTEGWSEFAVGGNIGTTFDAYHSSQYWAQEVRYWDEVLIDSELDDHTLNFQSYGVKDILGDLDKLKVHWRLREDVTASIAGAIAIEDVATESNISSVSVSGFEVSQNPYKKFLNDYNYIASLDFGWGEEKIRSISDTRVRKSDFVDDNKFVSLEFNMIDALNEDIVQSMQSMDRMNEVIGFPANKYRVQYDELEIIRHNYFKRLQGRLNFRVFADMLDFFDRSFISMIRKLIPARANFIGDEFVVESHLLERPKVTYERRKYQEMQFVPEGRIEMWTRFGRNDDKSGSKFPFFLSGSGL